MAGLPEIIASLRATGLPLVLLWILTLAVVYGVLSHIGIPKSKTVQGVISIAVAFLVLFGAAVQAAAFVSNMITAGIVVAFGLLIAVIFFELVGLKAGEHVFAKHPKFFATVILLIVILIFIGAGGLGILKIPFPQVPATTGGAILAVLFFVAIMAITVYVLMREAKEK